MIAIISPAKLMDLETQYPGVPSTTPKYVDQSASLIKKLKKLSVGQLAELMDISLDLADVNKKRIAEWTAEHNIDNARHAVLTFSGDTYRGLQAPTMSKAELKWAQDHLIILSGLYGMLRPLDLMKPYRLMMGTPFSPDSKTPNLYAFWSDILTADLAARMKPDEVLVNLASGEYIKSIQMKKLGRRVITCEFKEWKEGKHVTIMTFAKQARGMMARYMISNKIQDPELLKGFSEGGYMFNDSLSKPDIWVFTRKLPPPVSKKKKTN